MIRFLLDNRAEVNAADKYYRTPLDLAPSLEIKVFLRMYGGQSGEVLYEAEKKKLDKKKEGQC